MYKKLVMGLFILLSALTASAQTTTLVTGSVTDSTTKQGVPFVTITVQDSQKKTVKQLAGDANGKYEFSLKGVNKGTINLSAVGYGSTSKSFSFAKGQAKYTVPSITMSESNTKIDQVVVQGQKQLIKIEPDKISYNPEADPETQTLNALDMMRKVPLLTVDGDDKINLKGASNFKILINGKESPLMSNNASDVLKSMPANSIKNIEVITNPSSKYSADGVGGIINIITNQNNVSGFSGNVSARADNFGGFGSSLYATAKIGKFAFSANYGYNKNKRPRTYTTNTSIIPSSDMFHTTITDGYSSNSGNSNYFSGDLSYEIDSLNLITASFWGHIGSSKQNAFNTTNVLDNNEKTFQEFENSSKSKSTMGMGSATIDFQHSYLKPDKLLTASYMIDFTPDNSESENDVVPVHNYLKSRMSSDNDASAYSHTFQLDFVNPISDKHQYEIGAKYILRTNDSDTKNKTFDYENNKYMPMNGGNELDYTQNIIAGYVGYTFKLKNFSTKVGARVEGTYTDASSTQMEKKTSFDNNLTDVVPYATIAYNISPTNSVKFSYTQRLQRPGIWYLNPYVNDLNPKNISYGNPDLETEKVNSFDLGYTYFAMKYSLNLSLYSRLDDNAIQDITFTDEESGATVQTYDNSGHNYAYGLSLYGSITPTPQLNLSLNTNFEYSTIEGQDRKGARLSNDGWSNTITGNARWNFLKNYTISAFGGYYDGWLSLQSKTSALSFSGVSLRRDFLDKKLSLTLSCNNPFNKYINYTSTTEGSDLNTKMKLKMENRTFRIALNYRFGKMGKTVVKTKRSISNDDLKSGSSESGSSEGMPQQ